MLSPFIYGALNYKQSVDLTYTSPNGDQTTQRIDAGLSRYLYEVTQKATGVDIVTGNYSFNQQKPFLTSLAVGLGTWKLGKYFGIRHSGIKRLPFTI